MPGTPRSTSVMESASGKVISPPAGLGWCDGVPASPSPVVPWHHTTTGRSRASPAGAATTPVDSVRRPNMSVDANRTFQAREPGTSGAISIASSRVPGAVMAQNVAKGRHP